MLRGKAGVLSLAQGIVHWPPPPEAITAARAAADEPSSHLYGADDGLPELRAALKAKLAAENGLTASEVMVTAGANQASSYGLGGWLPDRHTSSFATLAAADHTKFLFNLYSITMPHSKPGLHERRTHYHTAHGHTMPHCYTAALQHCPTTTGHCDSTIIQLHCCYTAGLHERRAHTARRW